MLKFSKITQYREQLSVCLIEFAKNKASIMFIRFSNFLIIIILTFITFFWTFTIFQIPFNLKLVLLVSFLRILSSIFIFKDFYLSWSKITQKTFLIKSFVYTLPLFIYLPLFYKEINYIILINELFIYLFFTNFIMYLYYFWINKSSIEKTSNVIIFGAGKAGIKLEDEFRDSKYKVKYFVDDDNILQKRTIDTTRILSREQLKKKVLKKNEKYDLLIIAIPSANQIQIKDVYDCLHKYFHEVRILPSLNDILRDTDFSEQLKELSVEDLLARHPKDLDKIKIASFILNETILITGAGGSIGSEISKQCAKFGAKKLILLDHSEFNLYTISEELEGYEIVSVMQSVKNQKLLEETLKKHKPTIVIHAAAYKHVPLVEDNIEEAILNNIIGTKNCIDLSIQYKVKKFILISTDKAVRPTNIMGATKRVCELYAQNSNGKGTDIVAVRFGNVLGSSGSVIPKFKKQIANGENLTVTHPEITRYFMLISEACELVLQAGAIGSGGEIFILDMGSPVKIVDLAKKMIELSEKENIKIEYTGLRPGEKLYEELLIDETDAKTNYESITIARPTKYNIDVLNNDIKNLLETEDKILELKKIVHEFNHQNNIKN